MNVLNEGDLERLVRRVVSRLDTENQPLTVHTGSYADLCLRLIEVDQRASEYYRWAEPEQADLVQLMIVAVCSVAQNPVFDADNDGFALTCAGMIADRNGALLDTEGCQFLVRLLIHQAGPDLAADANQADLRALFCDYLYKKEDQEAETVKLVGDREIRNPYLTAIITPPITGMTGEPLEKMEKLCDDIELVLRARGFSEIFQPIHYSSPDRYPVSSLDPELVRRSDVDNILRSDLVVAILAKPATGIGSVLTWAERGGLVQLLITDDPGAKSPLPNSSLGPIDRIPLASESLADAVSAFIEAYREPLDDHLKQRLMRPEVAGGDLRRFRDAFMRIGRTELAAKLPKWFTVERAIEIVRTVDHFVIMTNEEYKVLHDALSLGDTFTADEQFGLTIDDLEEANRFARSIGLSRDDYSQLLRAAAKEIEAAGLAVSHRRRTRTFWRDLYRRMR